MNTEENYAGDTFSEAIFRETVANPHQSEGSIHDNVDNTEDEIGTRDNAAINGITDGINCKSFREPIFNYPCYSPRLHDQMNDPISLFGSRQYSKWLRNFIFSGLIKQNHYYCKMDLTLSDLKIIFKRARQVFIGLKTHTSVRRKVMWRDYLMHLEMMIFLFDLLACACRNCFRVQQTGLFSIFGTDFLRLIQFPPPNLYKNWTVYQFYQRLLKGGYPGFESFLVSCSHLISPPLLSKVIIIVFVVLFCLYFTYPECFHVILICTVGRLLLVRLFCPTVRRWLLLYFLLCSIFCM